MAAASQTQTYKSEITWRFGSDSDKWVTNADKSFLSQG